MFIAISITLDKFDASPRKLYNSCYIFEVHWYHHIPWNFRTNKYVVYSAVQNWGISEVPCTVILFQRHNIGILCGTNLRYIKTAMYLDIVVMTQWRYSVGYKFEVYQHGDIPWNCRRNKYMVYHAVQNWGIYKVPCNIISFQRHIYRHIVLNEPWHKVSNISLPAFSVLGYVQSGHVAMLNPLKCQPLAFMHCLFFSKSFYSICENA